MYLSLSEHHGMDLQALREFVTRELPEDHYLDYKGPQANYSQKSEKNEFLKDVVGFANGSGGLILIGVEEPDETLTAEQQLIGIQDGQTISQNLERSVNDSIDPKVSGFQIKSVPLENGNDVVVAFVPNSASKPHMVKLNRFHIRGSESTNVMTAEQVSSMVLSNYNRKLLIDSSIEENVSEYTQSILGSRPGFVLQAFPTTELIDKWNVHENAGFANVIEGRGRNKFHGAVALRSSSSIPGLECIRSFDFNKSPDEVDTFVEIRTDGTLISVLHNKDPFGQMGFPTFAPYKNQLFCAFGHMLDETLSVSGMTSPYLVSATYVNTDETKLYFGERHIDGGYSPPRQPLKDPMNWAPVIVKAGESAEDVCSLMGRSFYHSFGFSAPDRLPTNDEDKFDKDGYNPR